MSTILVTGASGFVGSHAVPALLAAGHRVVALSGRRVRQAVIDRLPDGSSQRGAAHRRRHQAWLAPRRAAGVDGVLHLVALPRDRNGGEELRLVNTEGTRALVVAMQAAGVKRLVHMGAMGVKDDPALHYASSKAKAEALVAASDLDWTILKPSLQFGPGDGFFNIIADLARMSPGIIPVPGNGKSRFQPISVKDVAIIAAKSFGATGRSGRPSSSAALATGRIGRSPPRYWPRPASAVPSSPCRCRSSGSWPAHPRPSACRFRSPRTSSAS